VSVLTQKQEMIG